MSENKIQGVYLGDRGMDFKKLIIGLLKRGKIKKEHILTLLKAENMAVYNAVFTSDSVDENDNYQVYEQLGDLTGNKFIVWYIYERFPQLKCLDGVKVAARLKINYGAKNSFCKIAESLGFWPFISATNDLRQRTKKSLLEDVFEAFLGATEYMLDQISFGLGYICVYRILKSIFDEMPISLKYEDLYDAKTRLKELFDLKNLGELVYEDSKKELITYSTAYSVVNNQREILGEGSAALKIDAQQVAAKNALSYLSKKGITKKVPEIYERFNKEPSTEEDIKSPSIEDGVENILKICHSAENINNQFLTRGKTKSVNKYTSTILADYCRKRDLSGIKICLIMGADPNILDSNGLTALDLLVIGKKDKIVLKIIKFLIAKFGVVKMNKNVYDYYPYIKNDKIITI